VDEPLNTITAILTPIASIGLGFVMLYIGWKSYTSTRDMSTWAITRGIIIKSNVKQSGAALLPDVEYRYSVLGVEYKGISVTIPPDIIYDVKVAQGLLEEYPVGKEVDVFYNPELHRVAVLEQEAAVGSWWILFIMTGTALFFLILGFAYLVPLITLQNE
jgi:hypothetical protein